MPRLPKDDLLDRARACLIASAIGDALGGAVEFMSLSAIRAKHGPKGITRYDTAYGRKGAITDDTQMTLFSAEGLINAWKRGSEKGICHVPTMVGLAYQRWMATQGEGAHPDSMTGSERGWLVDLPDLNHRRAPGNTCLSALRQWDHNEANNDSKGCGTVMRSAPFGFFPDSWRNAWDCAALSHGHIEAKASAAIMAHAISLVLQGIELRGALLSAAALDKDSTKSAALIHHAVDLADQKADPDQTIKRLGEGWVAEEALAVGAYCALFAGHDLHEGLRLAANHSGDSDSTGSICGNLMGGSLGWKAVEALPPDLFEDLELRDVIERMAQEMIEVQF